MSLDSKGGCSPRGPRDRLLAGDSSVGGAEVGAGTILGVEMLTHREDEPLLEEASCGAAWRSGAVLPGAAARAPARPPDSGMPRRGHSYRGRFARSGSSAPAPARRARRLNLSVDVLRREPVQPARLRVLLRPPEGGKRGSARSAGRLERIAKRQRAQVRADALRGRWMARPRQVCYARFSKGRESRVNGTRLIGPSVTVADLDALPERP